MAPSSDTRAVTRPRATTLLVGAGVLVALVIVALVTVIVALAGRGNSGAKAASVSSASPSPSTTSSPSVSDIFQHVGPSVAVVRTAKGALGTGVIANAAGAVITANHVIADGSAITIRFADGTDSSATVASADPTTDIAVLTPATLPQPIVPATFGGSAATGAQVVAIGNPLGLTDSVSVGVVSGWTGPRRQGHLQRLIQFDASVNPGSSGGPLLDAGAWLSASLSRSPTRTSEDAFAGIGFAVPIGSALGGTGGPGPGERTTDMTGRPTRRAQMSRRPASNPLEQVLYEVKKTIVGQDVLLERWRSRCCPAGTSWSRACPGWPRRWR